MKTRILPTPRLVLMLILAASGLMVAPVAHSALWVSVLADVALLAAALVDWGVLRNTSRCRLQRQVSEVLSLGAENPVAMQLENSTSVWLGVEIFDEAPIAFEIDPMQLDAEVPAAATFEGTYVVRPTERGNYHFGSIRVRYRTRLGLLVTQRVYERPEAVRVYPNVMEIQKARLLGQRRHLELMGMRRFRGATMSTEFDSLRDYQPDDEPRRIDWKASARRSRLIVRHYQVERSQYVMLLMDVGRLMASKLEKLTKLDHAINAALMLTWVAAQADDRVGVLAFDHDVVGYLSPGKGRGQVGRVARFLYPLMPRRSETDYRRAFSYLASTWRRRALIVLFTDLVDPEASESLLADVGMLLPRHRVLCVALSDYELDAVLAQPPRTAPEMYEQAAARSIQRDREGALARLRARGVLSLDAAPSSLTPAVVNRYLALKATGW